jgi:hypothetical protein
MRTALAATQQTGDGVPHTKRHTETATQLCAVTVLSANTFTDRPATHSCCSPVIAPSELCSVPDRWLPCRKLRARSDICARAHNWLPRDEQWSAPAEENHGGGHTVVAAPQAVVVRWADALTDTTTTYRSLSAVIHPSQLGSEPDSLLDLKSLCAQDGRHTRERRLRRVGCRDPTQDTTHRYAPTPHHHEQVFECSHAPEPAWQRARQLVGGQGPERKSPEAHVQ